MTPQRWREISRMYSEATGRDAAARAAFLAEACAGDSDLRHEVESLLAEDDGAELLAAGSIGHYQLRSLLGSGGMGQVYRGHDATLQRDVAVKVVPRLFAADPQRRARVRREAQLLASLNHPNIAQIYGIEEADGVYALILELVDGPTLADCIARGPMPSGDALVVARQIGRALQAAHERNIVHRDLKPDNIKVGRDGTVKILDFGLAKALASEEAGSDVLVTTRGAVLGTVAYMAPEQARGQESDQRVDIWAFAVVLYEMLSGRSPFVRTSMAGTIGAILHTEPDWKGIPRAVQPVLRQCLEKDPARRCTDIAAAVRSLDAARSGVPTSARRVVWTRAAVVAWMLATVALVCLVFAGGNSTMPGAAAAQHAGEQQGAVRYQVSAPTPFTIGSYFVLSPDGRHLAFWATDPGGRRMLWIHSLDWGRSQPLPGAGAVSTSSMLWAPDGRRLAFVDNTGLLRQIDIGSGQARTICPLGAGWGGGSWNGDDQIVFGQQSGGLLRVSASGGNAVALTSLDAAHGEIGHGGPRFLPDGRHFVYARATSTGSDGIYTGAIDVAPELQPATLLMRTRSRPVYAPSHDPAIGHLLLVDRGKLLAYPFDARALKVTGEAIQIAGGVGAVATGGALVGSVSASATGVLAFRSRREPAVDIIQNWMEMLKTPAGRQSVPIASVFGITRTMIPVALRPAMMPPSR
jgi:eukaryotic-like serine/threonine-protein kinase